MQRSYPPNWHNIALERKIAAGWHCEWCDIAHGEERTNRYGKPFREVLACAHLGVMKPDGAPGDKYDLADCRIENLAVLCTRCHLDYDIEDHLKARRENEIRRQLAAGQLVLVEIAS